MLGTHHEEVTKKIDPNAATFIDLIPGNGDEAVTINKHGAVMIDLGGQPAVANSAQLNRLGLDEPARYHAALARALVHSAKVKGDPEDPAVLERARQILTSEIADAAALSSWLALPGHAATVHQLLVDHVQLTAKPNELFAPALVRIGKIPGAILQISGEIARAKREQGELRTPRIEIVTSAGAHSNASLADLHRFGIRDQAALDARLSEAIAKGPRPKSFAKRAERVRLLALRAEDDADLELLDRYRKSAGMNELRISGDDMHAIELGSLGKLYLMHDANYRFSQGKSGWPQVGWPRELNLTDFDRQKIGSAAELKTRFAEAIILQAGLSGPASDAALLARARVQLGTRIDEIDGYMSKVHRATDFDLLTRHHELGTHRDDKDAWMTVAKPVVPLFLAEDAEHALLWHDGQLRAARPQERSEFQMRRHDRNTLIWVRQFGDKVVKPNYINPVSFEQLSRFGMRNLEEFDAHMARRMLDAAGMPASFPASLPDARKLLQQQIDDAPTLSRYIDAQQTGGHPGATNLLRAYRTKAKPDADEVAAVIVLAKDASARLTLGSTRSAADVNIMRVDNTGNEHKATVADLRRFGLGTVAAFDAAVARAGALPPSEAQARR